MPTHLAIDLGAPRHYRDPRTDRMLLMGDLFHYFLTGVATCEITNASTSQCYDPRAKAWAVPMIEKLGLPARIFPLLLQPGSVIGPVRPSVAAETGLAGVRVVTPATHDTGSAVAAVPAEPGARWAYLSSGTWSLIGIESPRPVVTDAAYASNFTNEVGVGGTIRLLKNVMGLWLVQECRRTWEAAGTPTPYDQVAPLALKAPALRSLIDPDDGVIEKLEAMQGGRIDVLHVGGGGSRNDLLNRFTATALGRPVLADSAGPAGIP